VVCLTREISDGVESAVKWVRPVTMVAPVHSGSGSHNALPVCLGRENLNRLVSLWDIVNQFDLLGFSEVLIRFQGMESHIRGRVAESGAPMALRNAAPDGIIDLLTKALTFSRNMAFADAAGAIEIAIVSVRNKGATLDTSTVEANLDHAKAALLREVTKRKYVSIDQDRSQYVDREHLFGEAVSSAFPSATDDIREAGNCIAVECGTATVFHLMRAVEYALRKLARKLHVRLTHKGRSHPIEFADWDKVITGIHNEITKARSLSPGPKRQAKLEVYSDVADHCLYMKDIWRNNISHARQPYLPSEALGVLERVRDFMNSTATVVP